MQGAKSGRWFAVSSMVMALVSLAVAPLVCGALGILLGMVAVIKGDRYWGMLGVIAGAVLGFNGYYIALEMMG